MSKDVSNLEPKHTGLPGDTENLTDQLERFLEQDVADSEDSADAAAPRTQEESAPEEDNRAQMADTIAAAIASTFQEEAAPSEEHPEEAPQETDAPEEQLPEQKETKNEPPQAAPVKKQAPEKSKGTDQPQETVKQAPPHNPGTGHKKIARSHIQIKPREQFASAFSGVFERRAEALPAVGTDLRSAEKSLSVKTGIDRMLNPIRYVILLLSFMCLAGRKYSWMTLGFMKGIGGVYISMLFTLILLILNWQSVYRAVRDAFYLQISYETCLLFATLITALDVVITKNADSLLPLLTMSWCFCGMANLMDAQGNLRFLRGTITGRNRTGIRMASKRYQGQDLVGKAPSGTAGFVRSQAEMDVWHSGNSWFVLPLTVVCIIVSAYLSARTEGNYFTILALLLDMGMPLSMVLCCARPYALLSQALAGKGVVAGWKGMKELSGKKSILIYDNDLFPKGTMGHKGIKVYGRFTASQLISYGASMAIRADVGLTEAFTRLLRDGDGELLEVRDLQVLEGGLGGRIHGGTVLLGTYQFMQLMGVDLPRKPAANGVYIAVNGQLAGMFAVKYALRSGSASAFRRITQERTLTPLIATKNFAINPAFVEKFYKAPIQRMVCPKTLLRHKLSRPEAMKGGTVCGFVLRDGISPYTRTVAGARRVRRMGIIYTVLSMVLTLYLTFNTISAIANGTELIEITRVLLMHFLLWLAVEVGARFAVRG